MAQKPVFLAASWERLLMINYIVDPAILIPFLPAGTELDLWNGQCYVSIVGFMFKDTRIKGIQIPFHINFEEVNLRFYVRRNDPILGWKRAVVFISEIVPKRAIVWVANTIYKEHYAYKPMQHQWMENQGLLEVNYGWYDQGRWQRIGVKADASPIDLKPGSEAEFITEHYWGYSKRDKNSTVEYQVEHPRWRMHPILEWFCDIDFEKIYGQPFAHLHDAAPKSVFLAEGSAVAVYQHSVINSNQ